MGKNLQAHRTWAPVKDTKKLDSDIEKYKYKLNKVDLLDYFASLKTLSMISVSSRLFPSFKSVPPKIMTYGTPHSKMILIIICLKLFCAVQFLAFSNNVEHHSKWKNKYSRVQKPK